MLRYHVYLVFVSAKVTISKVADTRDDVLALIQV